MTAPVFVADEIVTAAKLNSLPKGVLGFTQVTTNPSTFTAEADLTGLSVAVTVEASRRLRIRGHLQIQLVTAGGTVQVHLKEGATQLGRVAALTMVTNDSHVFDGSIVVTPTAGAHTYKLTAVTTGGTGTPQASATAPGFILVEDIGGV